MNEEIGERIEQFGNFKEVILKQLDRVNQLGTEDIQNDQSAYNSWCNGIKTLEYLIQGHMSREEIQGLHNEIQKNFKFSTDIENMTSKENIKYGRELLSIFIREANMRGLLGGSF